MRKPCLNQCVVLAITCCVLSSSSAFGQLPDIIDFSAGVGNEGADTLRVYGDYDSIGLFGGEANVGMAQGDLNGDGYDDLAIANTRADPLSRTDVGEIVIIYGEEGFAPRSPLDLRIATNVSRVFGEATATPLADQNYSVISMGDFDGDDNLDLVIGNQAGTTTPQCHILYGPIVSGSAIDLDNLGGQKYTSVTRDSTLATNQSRSMIMGDLDGDGADELVFGSPTFDAVINSTTRGNSGAVFVIFGAADRSDQSNINLNASDIDNGVRRLYGTHNDGSRGAGLGTSVGIGDFNGDGLLDLASGQPENFQQKGTLWLIFNALLEPGPPIDLLSSSPHTTSFVGISNGSETARHLSVGDYNGDGYDDIAAGSENHDGARGIVMFAMGNPAIEGIQGQFSTPSGIQGSGANYRLGVTLGSGDFDGDGFDDLLMSEWVAQAEGSRGYIVFGSPSFFTDLASRPLISSNPFPTRRVLVTSPDPTSSIYFGERIWSGGDLDSDGFEDFGLTAPEADNDFNPPEISRAGIVLNVLGEGAATEATVARYSPTGDGPGGEAMPVADFGPVIRATVAFDEDSFVAGYPKKLDQTLDMPDNGNNFYARDVSISPIDGSIYVSCRDGSGDGTPTTVRFNRQGELMGIYNQAFSSGQGRAIDHDSAGDYYVATACGNGCPTIWKYPMNGGAHINNYFSSTTSCPPVDPTTFCVEIGEDLAVDASGRGYYMDVARAQIVVCTLPNGGSPSILRTFGSGDFVYSGNMKIRDITMAPNGRLYTKEQITPLDSSPRGFEIEVFSSYEEGNVKIATIVQDEDLNRGLMVDESGCIYTTKETPYPHIRKYSPDGSLILGDVPGGVGTFGGNGNGGNLAVIPGNRILVVAQESDVVDIYSQAVRTDVTLRRQSPDQLEPSGASYWQVQSDGLAFESSSITFKYLDSEIAGMPESNLGLFTSLSPSGPWELLFSTVDQARNTISATVNDFGTPVTDWDNPGTGRFFAIGLAIPATRTQVAGAGDVNGDGFEDFLVSSFISEPDELERQGEAALVFGPLDIDNTTTGSMTGLLDHIDLDALPPSKVIRMVGTAPNEDLGWAISGAGDVNSDNFADILIGAPGTDRAYLVYGSSAFTTPNLTLLNGSNGVRLQGGVGTRAGYAVSGAGDLNGDGISDLVVGATRGGTGGEAYVLYGSPTGVGNGVPTLNLDLQTLQTGLGVVINSEVAADLLGSAVSGVGDIDGDGLADFLVGAYGAGQGVLSASGNAYLIYGDSAAIGTNGELNLSGLGSAGVRITGAAQGNAAGWSVAGAGDVNGDGFNDLLVSARNANSTAGSAYLLYGKLNGIGNGGVLNLASLANTDGFAIDGLATGDLSGAAARSAGDLNGDGYFDLVLGAQGADSMTSGSFEGNGASYVLFGDNYWLPGTTVNIDLASLDGTNGLLIEGVSEDQGLGLDVTLAGDFDADGLSELIISSADDGTTPTSFAGFSRIYGVDLTDSAGDATYRARARHGVGANEFDDQAIAPVPVGTPGDGRTSRPVSRASVGFTGGYTGTSGSPQPSEQIVEVRRMAPSDSPGSQFVAAPIHWSITTNRLQFSDSSIDLFYLPSEVTGFDLGKTGVYFKPDTPAQSGWEAVSANHDTERGIFRVRREHVKASARESFNGIYAIFEGELTFEMGREIAPPPSVNVNDLLVSGPEISPSGAAFWHQYRQKLYATKAGSITVRWKNSSGQLVGSAQSGTIQWPSDQDMFQKHVANTPEVDLRDGRFAWTQLMDTEATVDDAAVRTAGKFSSSTSGRTLLMLSESNDPQNGDVYFLFVSTFVWNNPNQLDDNLPATIGEPIPTHPEHNEDCGDPYMFNENSAYNAGNGYHDRSARTGDVLPVNLHIPGVNDEMVLVWYEANGDGGVGGDPALSNMYNPDTGSPLINEICWPFKPARYDCQWPAAPGKIILAKRTGTGEVDPLTYTVPSLYVQNDPELPGFNPNDEHAYQDGSTFFAHRHDLGTPTTSQPYVLINYTEAGPGGDNRMLVYQVLDEEAPYSFSYGLAAYTGDNPIKAGGVLAAPTPLDRSEKCRETTTYPVRYGNYGVSGPYFKDRKSDFWAYAAGDDGTTATITMRWFYRTRSGFYFPDEYRQALSGLAPYNNIPFFTGDEPVVPGTLATCVPWLDDWNNSGTGVPQDVSYRIVWPTVPTLLQGETLVRQKYGLPNIKDQPSVEILYQQADALNPGDTSVELIDGTRGRYVDFSATLDIPDVIRTSRSGTKILFEDLPEVLRSRIYVDTNFTPSRLYFIGEFVTVVAGEDVLLPNVMTERERDQLIRLDSPEDGELSSVWDQRINDLFNDAKLGSETSPVKEVLTVEPTDKVWETLALTSARADASGYVTLAFGNLDDPSIVPTATPVRLEVIRVDCPLYRGEVKTIYSTCVFDEKVTLRHSGDFAGGAGEYDFEWYYAIDTTPPNPDYGMDGRPTNYTRFTGLPAYPGGGGTPERGAVEATLQEGAGILTLVDTWWIARYKPRDAMSILCCGNDELPETTFYYGDAPDEDEETAGYQGPEPILAIPDNDTQGIIAELFVENGPASITGLNFSFDPGDINCGSDPATHALAHSRISDLEVTLISPTNDVMITLLNRTGVTEEDPDGNTGSGFCGTVFSDFGSEGIDEAGPLEAPFTGLWQANEPLSVASNDVNGTWTLMVRDLAPGETGELRRFSLNFLTDPASTCNGGETEEWSAWTNPQLAEGWIKRVLGGIDPFAQRITKGGIAGAENRFFNYETQNVNTIVSMISQAGERWEGSVPLSCENIDEFGLIEIYETVLQRGIELSIDGPNPIAGAGGSTADAVYNALLLVAGRIADLYALLGNEAYADSVDPTIAFGTDDGQYGSEATSIHAFMNQASSLLEEELFLLRGRDDTRSPGNEVRPVYNRLFWNFTRDITGGEVAYALNYNILDELGNADSVIDEEDAAALYPQGHGDAWGHYLTAAKRYYRLLRHPNFVWRPRAEAVTVGGVAVEVDYLDERKFAQAAAAKARTGKEILDLTYRSYYVEDPLGQWQGYKDDDPERAWGVSEWASRSAHGAFFDWVAGNAMLPDEYPGVVTEDIEKVDRTTVRELDEVAAITQEIQAKMDEADAGMNPLGIARNMVPFDIDPVQIDQGRTHFEQVYDRAVRALNNAITVFNHANNATQLLRRQSDQVADFQKNVQDRESDFNNRLIEIFGYPYADDIGPGGTYPTGYDGPDLYHYDYVDPVELFGGDEEIFGQGDVTTFQVQYDSPALRADGSLVSNSESITYHLSADGFGMVKPDEWAGSRRAQGEIQFARSEIFSGLWRYKRALVEYDNLLAQIEDQAQLLQAQHEVNDLRIEIQSDTLNQTMELNDAIKDSRVTQLALRAGGRLAVQVASGVADGFPKNFIAGLAAGGDFSGPMRTAIKQVGAIASDILNTIADVEAISELEHQQAKELSQLKSQLVLTTAETDLGILQQVKQLEQLVRNETSVRLEIYNARESFLQTTERYKSALARGQRLLEDLGRFRSQTAAQTQEFRYKDMAFRIFRNDALQKYRAQFDLAARYVYMAAKAYDYETNLLPGDPAGPGQDFLTDIVRARTIGLVQNGQPVADSGTGDAGLADPMARMFLNWDLVLKGQLGFNNPQTETNRFSLRTELLRVREGGTGEEGRISDDKWREQLNQWKVDNIFDIPEFERYCRPFQPHNAIEPGIVIPVSTAINFGLNFFGNELGGGDSAYDSSNFATKVRSVGVWFSNYNNLSGSGMSNTPRVYLIPVGEDVMRSPSDDGTEIRSWRVLDQKLPVPFPLSPGQLDDPAFIPINDSLTSEFADLRQYSSFRAYHDSGSFNEAETHKDSRLIGRSVWNTKWLLVIPAGTLHSNRDEALERFINGRVLTGGERDGNGVKDIKLFFQTYAYSGN